MPALIPRKLMSVVTRFAPSPTGFLHIGGARTALFNWLFARHHGGRFRLRVEDTDRRRSTEEAVQAIFDGLDWLGLDWDGDAVFQFQGAARHAAAAQALVAAGKAYFCYCSADELSEMRALARAEGRQPRYDGRWRDRDPAEAPADVAPAIRLRMPQQGETLIADLVQGEVRVANAQLDDMILVRGDGSPTYMLSVVIDDHDMGITHVIRGDDHLTNAARQFQLFDALGWTAPAFAHIPLIHGPDGAKLSKRHGALGVDAYRDMGILPAAMRNYLLRLGWSHGDDEIIDTDQAVAWFDLDAVGRGPARIDLARLGSLNAHYLRHTPDGELAPMVAPRIAGLRGGALDDAEIRRLVAAMPGLKERAKNLEELADGALFYFLARPIPIDDAAARLLDERGCAVLARLSARLAEIADWRAETLEQAVRAFAEAEAVKLGKIAQPLRAAISGAKVSPGIFEALAVLGRDESLGRIDDVLTHG